MSPSETKRLAFNATETMTFTLSDDPSWDRIADYVWRYGHNVNREYMPDVPVILSGFIYDSVFGIWSNGVQVDGASNLETVVCILDNSLSDDGPVVITVPSGEDYDGDAESIEHYIRIQDDCFGYSGNRVDRVLI